MEPYLIAIIGGLFTLAGIWLKHHLDSKSGSESSSNHAHMERGRSDASTPFARRPDEHPRRASGLAIGAALLAAVPAIFLVLNTDIPDELGWILFFAGGACFVSGVYSVASHFRHS
jgi:hypothetical protein